MEQCNLLSGVMEWSIGVEWIQKVAIWNLCFISLLYLDLYVLGDDALISKGSFMQTKYLYVLIHIWIKGEVGAVKPV